MATETIDFDRVCSRFNIEKLTPVQEKSLKHLIDGKDVFLSIKTGGGKSICYQAFPVLREKTNPDCKVLIISPLISIMQEQCQELTNLGFSASYIGKSKIDDASIYNGKIQFVFSSPESLLSVPRWREWLQNQQIDLLVVDEAHTVILWSDKSVDEPFRKWFGNIGETRCFLACPILVITATASKSKRTKLHRKLALVDCVDIVDSPDRDNIKLFAATVKTTLPLEDTFQWLLTMVAEKKEICPRHIIFTTIRMCGTLFTMFKKMLPPACHQHIQMFHSVTPESVKEVIREDMGKMDGCIRVLMASSSAGMGVNFKGVLNVVHYGPPRDMDSFVQQLGRAGRDGDQSYHLLLYHGQHVGVLKKDKHGQEMLTYVANKDLCRRQVILDAYQATKPQLKQHLCCDICTKSCTCGDADCSSVQHPFFQAERGPDGEEDTDSDMWDSEMSKSSQDSSE